MYQRIPDEKVSIFDITKTIQEKTGFPKMHIKEVIEEYINSMELAMIDKKAVSLGRIGTLYPTIKPAKNVVRINKFEDKGAELMRMEARWVCKFKVKPLFSKRLLEKEPTEKEVDNIYR